MARKKARQEGHGALAAKKLAIIFIDVVESVRLQQFDQIGFANAWSEIVSEAMVNPCRKFGATLVKSLGDGLMLTAPKPSDAVGLAIEVLRIATERSAGLPAERRIELHSGIDYGEVLLSAHDIYGHAANVAARLASIAQPGQIVLSDRVRMDLSPEHDPYLVDLGNCHLRNVEGTIRCHALQPNAPRSLRQPIVTESSLHPVVAVLPPVTISGDPATVGICEAFADAVIADLSRVGELKVISRLSTRRIPLADTDVVTASREMLTADYVLFGRLIQNASSVSLALEFSDGRTGTVLWTDQLSFPVDALFGESHDVTRAVAEHVVQSILKSAVLTSRSSALFTLENYTLLLSGIASMYSLHRPEFERARLLLSSLADRGAGQSTTLTWLAKWHVMNAVQGWSEDVEADRSLAMDLTARALDADPSNALAYTVRGLACTNLARRFDLALDCFESALGMNPNEPLAWLIRGALYSFSDRGKLAVRDTSRALALSPLDPNRFYKLALAAGAHLTAGEDETALELAQASLRANRLHHSTLRILAAAQWRLGLEEESRATIRRLMELAPGFTVSKYQATAPNAGFRIGSEIAGILVAAGVPP